MRGATVPRPAPSEIYPPGGQTEPVVQFRHYLFHDCTRAARLWAGRIATACAWPQEVHRFRAPAAEPKTA